MRAAGRGRRRPHLDVVLAVALLAGGGLAVADAAPTALLQDQASGDAFAGADALPSGRAAVDQVLIIGAQPAVSGDGRFVAFNSQLGNLVPGVADSNAEIDTFLFDRTTGSVEVVSLGSGPTPVGGIIGGPSISDDGRYVVFTSSTPSVVAGDDAQGRPDVFRRDRQTGTTARVSLPVGGGSLNSEVGAMASQGAISDDGRWVVYESGATNLVAGDSNEVSDVFVRDMNTNASSRVTAATAGQPDGDSARAVISGDGMTVAFQSIATNLVGGDTNQAWDVFVRPLAGGATERVNVRTNGTQTSAGEYSRNPSISDDGTKVAFESDDRYLTTSNNHDEFTQVYVRDRVTSNTSHRSTTGSVQAARGDATNPVISGDGSLLAYLSDAPNAYGGLTDSHVLGFVVSTAPGAPSTPGRSISRPDGSAYNSSGRMNFANAGTGTIALPDVPTEAIFVSAASNLLPVPDENQAADLFVRSTGAGTSSTQVLGLMPTSPVGNLVVDGSFEKPAVSSGPHDQVTVYGRPAKTTMGAWRIDAGGLDVVGHAIGSAGDGFQYIDLNGGSNEGRPEYNGTAPETRISQTIATTPNRRYRLSALIAGNPREVPPVKEMRIRFGSLTRDTSFLVSQAATNHNLGWEEVVLDLDACSTSTEVSFATQTVGVRGPLLDKVRVVDIGPAQVPCCVEPGPFRDVNAAHPFCEDITWLVGRGITTGYGDGGYHPDAPVSRQAMAAFLSRADSRTPRPACTTAPFPDVPVSHTYCREIAWMKASGIAGGYADGTFKPTAPISRQAMSAFLQRAFGDGPADDCLSAPFPDIPTNHQFCREVRWMIREAVTGGYADGSFHPGASVSRQAMAAFLRRAASI